MAEEELKKLSKLAENKRCANCENESRFGHGNVCMQFKIFVCGNCKSAFQAFSFRVKSLSMSNFTTEEADSFRGRNGGGNDHARRTFQAMLPLDDPIRPREGDHPDKYKAFVQRVYMDRAYYSTDTAASGSGLGPARPTASAHTQEAAPTAPAAATSGAGLSAVKGRWGPPAAASAPVAAAPAAPAPAPAHVAAAPPPRTDSLGRAVNSGWDNQADEVTTGHDDGIKIRAAPAAEPEGDLLSMGGFSGGSAPSSSASAEPDLMFGAAASSGGGPSAASAAILAAYATPSAGLGGFGGHGPMMAPPRGPQLGGPFGSFGGFPGGGGVVGGGPMGGGGIPYGMGLAPQPFPPAPPPTPAFGGFGGSPVSGGGGLNAVMASLTSAASASSLPRQSSSGSESGRSPAVTPSSPGGGGLEAMMSNFTLQGAASKPATAAGPSPIGGGAALPLNRLNSGAGSSGTPSPSVMASPMLAAASPAGFAASPLYGTTGAGAVPGVGMAMPPRGAVFGVGDPFATLLPPARPPHGMIAGPGPYGMPPRGMAPPGMMAPPHPGLGGYGLPRPQFPPPGAAGGPQYNLNDPFFGVS